MAWTAVLKDLTRKDDAVELLVVLTDGTETRSYRYSTTARNATAAWLRSQVLQTVAGLTIVARDLIVGMSIDTNPDPDPPPPTKDDEDRHAFTDAYRLARGCAHAVGVGLFASNDRLMVDALDAARALFKPEYVNEL